VLVLGPGGAGGDGLAVVAQGCGDQPEGFVGGAEEVGGVGTGRDVGGDDEAGRLRRDGGWFAQGAAEGLDDAADAGGAVGEDDGVDGRQVDPFAEDFGVGQHGPVGVGEAGDDVGASAGAVGAVDGLRDDVFRPVGAQFVGEGAQGVGELASEVGGVGDLLEVDEHVP
jgi:hypothetical protein